jgi:hypothetical protein
LQRASIKSQQFAGGGQVQPQSTGNGLINTSPNIPTQPNGDNVFATVKVGEVILNKQQQAALGGARTFAALKVPGFAGGGRVFDTGGVQPPITSNGADGRLLFGQDTLAKNYASEFADVKASIVLLNERTAVIAEAVAATDRKPVAANEIEAKNMSRRNASSVGVI